MKCQKQKEMKNPTPVKLKNGRAAVKGVCPDCGTKMFCMGDGKGKKKGSGSRKSRRSRKSRH